MIRPIPWLYSNDYDWVWKTWKTREMYLVWNEQKNRLLIYLTCKNIPYFSLYSIFLSLYLLYEINSTLFLYTLSNCFWLFECNISYLTLFFFFLDLFLFCFLSDILRTSISIFLDSYFFPLLQPPPLSHFLWPFSKIPDQFNKIKTFPSGKTFITF